jgi:DNA-binding transcriptional LysR family regulator
VDLAALLASFRRAHPGVTIRLSHGAASALARAAADAELDIAFIDGPVDPAKLTRTELGRDYLVLAVPRGDPLARRASIRLDDPALRDRDFVEYRADSALRAQIDAACAAAGLSRRITCEVENMQYLVTSSNRCSTASASPCSRPWPSTRWPARSTRSRSRRRCTVISARS